MQRTEIVAAASGAVATALATVACCLPTGMLAAAGLTGVAATLAGGHRWLLLLSFVLVGAGGVQAYRANRCATKPGRLVLTLLAIAAAIVVLVTLFPQVIAGFLADYVMGVEP